MPPSRLHRTAVAVCLLPASACAAGSGAEAPGPSAAAPPEAVSTTAPVPEPARVHGPAVRTVVRLTGDAVQAAGIDGGLDSLLEVEVVASGRALHAVATSPAGVFGEELVIGTDYYVRMVAAEEAIGFGDWVLIDLSDERQTRIAFEHQVPLGLLDAADAMELEVGDHLLGSPVRAVEDLGERRRYVLDHHVVATVEQSTLARSPSIDPPAEGTYVPLDELAEWAARAWER